MEEAVIPRRSLTSSEWISIAVSVCVLVLIILANGYRVHHDRMRVRSDFRSRRLRFRPLPPTVHAAALREVETIQRLKEQVRPPWPAMECEVGAPSSEWDGVEFRKEMVTSSLRLQEEVRRCQLDIEIGPRRPSAVHDFVEAIRVATGLEKEDVVEYLRLYDKARRAGTLVTASDFRAFSKVWNRLVSRIQESSLRDQAPRPSDSRSHGSRK